MAVRQFNRKRRPRTALVQPTAAASKTAARKVSARRSSRPRDMGKRGQLPTIPRLGRHKSLDGREAVGIVLEAMQSFATALLDVENLMWTVHRGHAKAIGNLSAVARAVLGAATELKRIVK